MSASWGCRSGCQGLGCERVLIQDLLLAVARREAHESTLRELEAELHLTIKRGSFRSKVVFQKERPEAEGPCCIMVHLPSRTAALPTWRDRSSARLRCRANHSPTCEPRPGPDLRGGGLLWQYFPSVRSTLSAEVWLAPGAPECGHKGPGPGFPQSSSRLRASRTPAPSSGP